MGRSSLPLLNRTGNYLRWHNVWDDLNYFSIKYEEDVFLLTFLHLFFSNSFFFKKNFFSNFEYVLIKKLKITQYTFLHFNLKNFLNFILNVKLKRNKCLYLMQFFIFRFSNFYVLILRFFLTTLIKKKKKRFKPKINFSIFYKKVQRHVFKKFSKNLTTFNFSLFFFENF